MIHQRIELPSGSLLEQARTPAEAEANARDAAQAVRWLQEDQDRPPF